MIRSQWWPLGLLILAVISSTWLTFTVNNHPLINHAQEELNPDSFAEQVYVTIIHQPHADTTFITTPSITVYIKNQEPWVVTAKRGQLSQGINQLDLYNNVIMHQAQGLNNHEITLLTNAMTFYPNTQIANTTLPVTIQEPGLTLTGIGLNADLIKGILELKSDMQGVYENKK